MASEKVDLARAGTMQVTAQEGEAFVEAATKRGKKGKFSKHSTMKGTAKEAAELLGNDRPDPDAATRGQQKKLDEISTPPPAKKKKGAAADLKKANTMSKTLEEAKTLYGDIDMSEGRSLRKRPAPAAAAKPAMKKAGTMQKTAKEGKAFLKRGKKGAAKKKDEEKEENGDAE